MVLDNTLEAPLDMPLELSLDNVSCGHQCSLFYISIQYYFSVPSYKHQDVGKTPAAASSNQYSFLKL